MHKNKTTNLADFTPGGKLGQMFAKAKTYNHINAVLIKLLPETLNSLELCSINNNNATLITNNQATAFRAQQQMDLLIGVLHQVPELTDIQKISIKVDVNNKHY